MVAISHRSFHSQNQLDGEAVRNPVPILGSVKLLDTGAMERKGFSIQNVGPVDVYYSDNQRELDSVTPANLPSVGHLLASAAPALLPVIYPFFSGKIFARAQANGAQVEIMVYDCDVCGSSAT
jgi:hypothetical protein